MILTEKRKLRMVSFAIVILVVSMGVYFFFLNNEKDVDNITNGTSKMEKGSTPSVSIPSVGKNPEGIGPVKENKYYVIYIKQNNGTGSSFVPEKLNPSFKSDSDFNVSISIDDNGNIINDDKIIVIDNFLISTENKETIKNIAGTTNYDQALKEIEERVLETKKNNKKESQKK